MSEWKVKNAQRDRFRYRCAAYKEIEQRREERRREEKREAGMSEWKVKNAQ